MSQNLVKVEKSRWPPIVSLKSPQYFIQQISNSLHSQASYRTGKEILAGPREGENSIVEIKGWSFADLKLTLSKFYWEILPCINLIEGENPDSRSTINLSFHINIFILFNFFSWNNSIVRLLFNNSQIVSGRKFPEVIRLHGDGADEDFLGKIRSDQMIQVSASCIDTDPVNYSEQITSSW